MVRIGQFMVRISLFMVRTWNFFLSKIYKEYLGSKVKTFTLYNRYCLIRKLLESLTYYLLIFAAAIGLPNRGGKPGKTTGTGISNGKATLRLRAKGPATVEDAVRKITLPIQPLYEEWCHIVDTACFAPNSGQVKMSKIFRIHQPITLQVVSIERGNVGNFAEDKSGTIFIA